MSQRVILVHYHEIGLKGKNRSTFENRLVANLDRTLRGLPVARIGRISGHVLVTLLDDSAIEPAAALIAQVPGVARVSLAYRCNRVEQEWCDAAVEALSRVRSFESFKVHARKSATDYELHTLDINRIAGAALCDAFPDKRVEMHGPDVIVYVYVVQGDVYVYADASSTIGVGGLPVGSAGKVVTLLSSGFDSPGATWMLGRRGAVCVPVHFSGRPITTDESEWLCRDLIEQLRPAGIVGRMYVVPFGECQREIALATPQARRVSMYRRMRFSVAERIAKIEGAKAIVTG
ncbi:MAG: tRNA 4-thiouridine(8) synthase ThiI, partial [Atopobiaceae bacterium]|nr:tRNA 4-thiouridine(8) synthase ThiI [Atopobiaceae bacterium]